VEESTLESRSPYTGELLGNFPNFGSAEVAQAVARAAQAQRLWSNIPLTKRLKQLRQLRRNLMNGAEAFLEAIVRETGKPRVEALHEVMMVVDMAHYCEQQAPALLNGGVRSTRILKHIESCIEYCPRGVIAIISPWNYPFSIPLRTAVGAWATGNAVVMKPSELTSLMMVAVKKTFEETGLPSGLFEVVTGTSRTGKDLVASAVDMVVFTGSVRAGREVAVACAQRLIPCTLELGGKAALIVCEDAHLERAASAAVFGAFANSGQICISVERAFVVPALYEAFVQRVTELTSALRQGDPMQADTDVGCVTYPHQVNVAQALIKDALVKGATLKTGEVPDAITLRVSPTVLADCTPHMRVMHEEIFGPVLPIMKVNDEAHALSLANDSELGLFHYVFSQDSSKANALARQLDAGTVVINDVLIGYALAEAPFGGVKQSGLGRVHGPEGLRSMCKVKHICRNRLGFIKRDPLWFPYSKAGYTWLGKLLRWLVD